MRRIAIFVTVATLVVTSIISLDSQVFGQSAKKVLMIPREGYSSDLDLMICNTLLEAFYGGQLLQGFHTDDFGITNKNKSKTVQDLFFKQGKT